jgi:signal transduction histidine kinase
LYRPPQIPVRFLVLLALATVVVLVPRAAHATGCPPAAVTLSTARFALVPDPTTQPSDADLVPVELPDQWRRQRPEASGFARYRLTLDAPDGGGAHCGVLLPDLNMNAAVFVNGSWIGDGGSFEEPVAHNFNRPLYFEFPAALLHPGANAIDVLLFAYGHHFGRLGPVVVGPHAALVDRYESAFFRQIVLAQLGTALAVVTAVFIAVIWVGSGFQPLYGFFLATTVAWAINSLNYWVSEIPVAHWTWDRTVNAALDQFAVFLALFFHRLVGVRRPKVERALWTFSAVALGAAVLTPRAHFTDAMIATHVAITVIGAYVTVLSFVHRRALTRLEARVYLGAWTAQLLFSAHDLGIQLGLWRGVGYTIPYTVSCMMLAFGTTLALRFVRALRQARAFTERLEERVREREEELSRQFERSRELERRDILGRERQRLMREMHDGLGGQLMSSLALAEAGSEADHEVVTALRDSLEELRLVILSLDPGLTEVAPLLAALRGRLEPTLQRRGIRFRWRVVEAPTPRRFGPEQLLNVLRIAQEAITNAVRHAAPSTIEVATTVESGVLLITVRDDGRGFPAKLRRGRGLSNMERRAQDIGAPLDVRSGPDGTVVELRLTLG